MFHEKDARRRKHHREPWTFLSYLISTTIPWRGGKFMKLVRNGQLTGEKYPYVFFFLPRRAFCRIYEITRKTDPWRERKTQSGLRESRGKSRSKLFDKIFVPYTGFVFNGTGSVFTSLWNLLRTSFYERMHGSGPNSKDDEGFSFFSF